MDTIQLNLENLSEEERVQLKQLIEKANTPKSRVWKPKKGEMYSYLSVRGRVFYSLWSNDAVDVGAYEIGNCFMTNEEAEEETKRLKILAQWKRLSVEACEDENPWDGIARHWFVYYDSCDKTIKHDWYETCKLSVIYFPSEDSLLKAIETVGEDNVKRYILGVTDE